MNFKKAFVGFMSAVLCFCSFACFAPAVSAASPHLKNYIDDGYPSNLGNISSLNPNITAPSNYYISFYVPGSSGAFLIYFSDYTTLTVEYVNSKYRIVLPNDVSPRVQGRNYNLTWDSANSWWNSTGGSGQFTTSLYLGDYSDLYILSSSIPFSFNGEIHEPVDPNAPISVSVNPALYEGMTPNTITYPSKQGANGQTVTADQYTLDVTVSLTDAFLNQTVPISGSFVYSYFFTAFIVPSQYAASEDIRTIANNAIYTCYTSDHYLYTETETLDVDMHYNGSMFGTGHHSTSSKNWSCAEGITNCFVIDRSTGSKSFTINLENVPFEDSGYSSFNLVVLSHVTRNSEYGWIAYPYYFHSACPELAFSHKKEFPAEFADEVDGEIDEDYTKWELYDYYTVVSDTFSYNSYPTYFDKGFDKTPLDFTNTTEKVQDYDMHYQTGGQQEWRTESEFDNYKSQLAWGENFSSDFGIGTITDLMNGESTFFGFITASISVLPSWFLTILASAFVTLLAIVVIKWVL